MDECVRCRYDRESPFCSNAVYFLKHLARSTFGELYINNFWLILGIFVSYFRLFLSEAHNDFDIFHDVSLRFFIKAWMGPFQQEAALAAAQAQALAAEKATETVANVRKQLMEESPPRFHLDIELAAPTIIVPQNSKSKYALVVDLGITLKFHY